MKNIVVTGANKGLGLEFTRQLSKDNHVIATSRNISSEHELHSLPNVKVKKLDLLSDATIDQFVEDIADTPIDILINNAGIFHEEQFEGLDPNIWLDEMKINALSPISLTHKLMKNLKAGSTKKVIFLSSQMGSIDDNYSGGYYFYRSSKAALNASAMSLSIDWKDKNIAVLMMHPGWVRTDMGTSKAKLSIEESVTGMLNVIENFSIEQTGAFLNYAGQKLEW